MNKLFAAHSMKIMMDFELLLSSLFSFFFFFFCRQFLLSGDTSMYTAIHLTPNARCYLFAWKLI